jgi:hypothetical protein
MTKTPSIGASIIEANTRSLASSFEKNKQSWQRTLLLSEFERDFLYFFSGKAPEHATAYRQKWVEIAGTLFEEVLLLDALGNVVDTVPPFLSRDVHTTNTNNRQIKNALIENKSPALSPSIASNIQLAALSNLIVADDRFSVSAAEEHAKRWRDFLARRGVDLTSPNQEKETTSGNKQDDEDSFLVYD